MMERISAETARKLLWLSEHHKFDILGSGEADVKCVAIITDKGTLRIVGRIDILLEKRPEDE